MALYGGFVISITFFAIAVVIPRELSALPMLDSDPQEILRRSSLIEEMNELTREFDNGVKLDHEHLKRAIFIASQLSGNGACKENMAQRTANEMIYRVSSGGETVDKASMEQYVQNADSSDTQAQIMADAVKMVLDNLVPR